MGSPRVCVLLLFGFFLLSIVESASLNTAKRSLLSGEQITQRLRRTLDDITRARSLAHRSKRQVAQVSLVPDTDLSDRMMSAISSYAAEVCGRPNAPVPDSPGLQAYIDGLSAILNATESAHDDISTDLANLEGYELSQGSAPVDALYNDIDKILNTTHCAYADTIPILSVMQDTKVSDFKFDRCRQLVEIVDSANAMLVNSSACILAPILSTSTQAAHNDVVCLANNFKIYVQLMSDLRDKMVEHVNAISHDDGTLETAKGTLSYRMAENDLIAAAIAYADITVDLYTFYVASEVRVMLLDEAAAAMAAQNSSKRKRRSIRDAIEHLLQTVQYG